MNYSSDAYLRRAVTAAISANPGRTHKEIAQTVIEQNRELLREWVSERVEWLVRIAQRRENPYQMFLPGLRLGQALPVRKIFVTLKLATLPLLRESLLTVQRRRSLRADPREAQLRKLIAEMEPYAKAQRGLTVEGYCELRAGVKLPKAQKAAKG